MTLVVSDSAALRQQVSAWRAAGETVGFIPTMGALHAGHIALVRQAQTECRRTIASIFVNPKQFGPHEDFNRYPRQLEQDLMQLVDAGCDLLFAPPVETVYPPGFSTAIDPGPLATVLEGAIRPGHFSGVATVVTRLLMLAAPDQAFFGEKDYQQLLIIKQTVRDLALPVIIKGVPTVRDRNGLALSSRNAYLSPEERARALILSATLRQLAAILPTGADIPATLQKARDQIAANGFTLDYLELCDAATLAPAAMLNAPARILVAAKIGNTRLIDNMAVPPAA